MDVHPKDELVKNEVIEELWSSIKYPDAKKLRDQRARALRAEGWEVTTRRFDFSSLGTGLLYKLEATRRREVTAAIPGE